MNEEEAALAFFAEPANLPLALMVAEQTDAIRRDMNNRFWRELGQRIENIAPGWQVQLTEDRNSEDLLVGLHLQPASEQTLFLRPILEQQMIGETLRIYFGLMWNNEPSPDRLALPEVAALRDALQREGFKSNDKFLAWQWSPYYPRSQRFLLRFSAAADDLLDEASGLVKSLLVTYGPMLAAASAALNSAPHQAIISLDALRNSAKRP